MKLLDSIEKSYLFNYSFPNSKILETLQLKDDVPNYPN